MKRKILATSAICLVLVLLLLRLCVWDIVSVPQGKAPHAGGWALVNRWAYGLRLPWKAQTRIAHKQAARGDWTEYNLPPLDREEKADTGNICVGLIVAVPGDTLWYNNDTGEMALQPRRQEGFVYPIILPGRGKTIRMTRENVRFYVPTIMRHEPEKASLIGDSLCLSGKLTDRYTFQQDYYWISSEDDADRADSRSFGFVPHACLIGRLL